MRTSKRQRKRAAVESTDFSCCIMLCLEDVKTERQAKRNAKCVVADALAFYIHELRSDDHASDRVHLQIQNTTANRTIWDCRTPVSVLRSFLRRRGGSLDGKGKDRDGGGC